MNIKQLIGLFSNELVLAVIRFFWYSRPKMSRETKLLLNWTENTSGYIEAPDTCNMAMKLEFHQLLVQKHFISLSQYVNIDDEVR